MGYYLQSAADDMLKPGEVLVPCACQHPEYQQRNIPQWAFCKDCGICFDDCGPVNLEAAEGRLFCENCHVEIKHFPPTVMADFRRAYLRQKKEVRK